MCNEQNVTQITSSTTEWSAFITLLQDNEQLHFLGNYSSLISAIP